MQSDLFHFKVTLHISGVTTPIIRSIAESEREGTRAETRIGLSAKRTSPFKSAGGAVQSTTGSSDIPLKDARLLATHSIRIFPLHFPSRVSPCAVSFRFSSTKGQHATPRPPKPIVCTIRKSCDLPLNL